MKIAIKLLLIYIGMQILAAFVVIVPTAVYLIVQHQDPATAQTVALAPTIFLSFIFMGIYLWKKGYISKDSRAWSIVSPLYLVMAVIIWLSGTFILDFILSLMPWLPNWMEESFNILQSGWLGILCIALFAPILEELMFRGAITRGLLKKYSPRTAIVLSALVFGVFHFNPVQIVAATFIGLLLGWIYYKTASLIPCILIHILNNAASIYLNLKFHGVDNTKELFTQDSMYYMVLIAAIVIFAGVFLWMKRVAIPFPWKVSEQQPEEIQA